MGVTPSVAVCVREIETEREENVKDRKGREWEEERDLPAPFRPREEDMQTLTRGRYTFCCCVRERLDLR